MSHNINYQTSHSSSHVLHGLNNINLVVEKYLSLAVQYFEELHVDSWRNQNQKTKEEDLKYAININDHGYYEICIHPSHATPVYSGPLGQEYIPLKEMDSQLFYISLNKIINQLKQNNDFNKYILKAKEHNKCISMHLVINEKLQYKDKEKPSLQYLSLKALEELYIKCNLIPKVASYSLDKVTAIKPEKLDELNDFIASFKKRPFVFTYPLKLNDDKDKQRLQIICGLADMILKNIFNPNDILQANISFSLYNEPKAREIMFEGYQIESLFSV